ncbi:hypothetical protein DM860_010336 [Cuscuta australis]|uniref:F-box domain-containing protein n=1 Tax=Cuscuta australis TaxID=267555 RepID=A0A328D6R3_9ASTE|nr:hypothetical protein DM860_010336 [Cuscuta australis]
MPPSKPIYFGANKEKRKFGKIEITNGFDCNDGNKFVMPCNTRRTRRRIRSSYIPDEVVFEILRRLRADILHNVMRYVCRAWHNIICSPTFRFSHLENSTPGFLLQRFGTQQLVFFLKAGNHNDAPEVTPLDFEFSGYIASSCNGLVLIVSHSHDNSFSYVVNPVLKQQMCLPELPPHRRLVGSCSLAYATASKVHKVTYNDWGGMLVLTLGVDKAWRIIDTSQCALRDNDIVARLSPIVLGGYVYWLNSIFQYIVSFDVENETLKRIPLPRSQSFERRRLTLVALEGALCLIAWRERHYLFEVWLLMDREIGEWTKFPDVSLLSSQARTSIEDVYAQPFKLVPIGWLRGREFLVFRVSQNEPAIMVFDVKLGKVHSTVQESTGFIYFYHTPYLQSLVPLKC